MPAQDDLLFLGTHGHVVAVEKATGREVWKTSLPKTGYSVVSILVEDGLLLCASHGRAFGLDVETGEIRWTNHLRGLGHGHVYLSTVRQAGGADPTLLAAASEAQTAAATAGT